MKKESIAGLRNRLFRFWDKSREYSEISHGRSMNITRERMRMVGLVPRGSGVLDVGCGVGDNGRFFVEKRGCRYTGIDVSRTALAMGRRKYHHKRFRLVRGDMARLPFRKGSFDAVVSTYAIEHLVEPARAFSEMARVTRPGGRVILMSPAVEFPFTIPVSYGSRALNPLWRAWYYVRKTAWDFLTWADFSRAHFFIIRDPEVLKGRFTPDNDMTNVVSIRETRKFFLLRGWREVYRYSLSEKREPALKRAAKRALSLLLPPYRYAGVHLFIALEKPAGG